MKIFCAVVLVCCSLLSYAQTPAYPMPLPHLQFLDVNGKPLAGGKVCTYAGGTTTPLATYTDATGATPNNACVTLDSSGGANMWFGPAAYKVVVKDANGVTLWTADNVATAPNAAANLTLTGNLTVAGNAGIAGTATIATLAGAFVIDAAKITSGTIANAHINWAAPGAIGGTTPQAITGTTVNAAAYQVATNPLNFSDLAGAATKAQLPGIISAGECQIDLVGTGALGVLQTTDVSPFACLNKLGGTLTVTAAYCIADAGTTTAIMVTRNDSTNLFSGNCVCGNATVAACTLSGTPTLADGQWVNETIAVAAAGTHNAHLVLVVTK